MVREGKKERDRRKIVSERRKGGIERGRENYVYVYVCVYFERESECV